MKTSFDIISELEQKVLLRHNSRIKMSSKNLVTILKLQFRNPTIERDVYEQEDSRLNQDRREQQSEDSAKRKEL